MTITDIAFNAENLDAEFAALLDTEQEKRAAARLAWRQEAQAKREREALILRHVPFVKSLMGRYLANPGVVPEDLFQAGFEGMLRSVPLFRGDNGASFATFAKSRIKHGFLGYIRIVAAVVVPKWLDELSASIRVLEREADRAGIVDLLTDEELALALDCRVAHVRLARYPLTVDSLDSVVNEAAGYSAYSQSAEELAELAELRELLPAAIARLTERQQDLVAELVDEDGAVPVTTAARGAGMAELTARTHLARVRAQLRAHPTLEGWVPFE